MADVIKLVQGDNAPQLKLTLTDGTTGDPIDLTGATATLHVKPKDSSTLAFSRAATMLSNADRTNGICYIQWGATDLDRAAGYYDAEVEIYWSSTSTRETIYDMLSILIREDIA
jgi:hypothetical protein